MTSTDIDSFWVSFPDDHPEALGGIFTAVQDKLAPLQIHFKPLDS